jgi:hypothetical protein
MSQEWRMDITVTINNGDYRTRGEGELQIAAHPDVIGTIDVTNAIKKLVAQAMTDIRAKIAEKQAQDARDTNAG